MYRKSSRNDGGFSVLELMVALLLFSALGIAVWSGLAGGQNLVRRSVRVAAGTARLLHLELYLRRAALRVRTPYWAVGPGVEAAGQGLRVPWVDGQAEDSLFLDVQEGRLRVRVRQGEPGLVFGPFQSVECSVFADGSGQPAGLKVSVIVDAGDPQPLVILAPFGGSPFPPWKGP